MSLIIKHCGRTAEYTSETGKWKASTATFAGLLNAEACPERLVGYYPDPEDGIEDLVRKALPGIQVTRSKKRRDPEGPGEIQ